MPELRVCLINPRDTVVADPCWDEPLGLLYLASSLEERGYPVEVVDMNFHKDLKILLDYRADVYGMYCSSAILKSALKTNSFIKKHFPEAQRIVGGPHASFAPLEMARYFDKVIIGEGEKALIEVLEGKWIGKLAHSLPIENLDVLPFPARHLVPIQGYHRRVGGRKSTGLFTARGCPHSCVFCSKVWGTKVRFRSAENVISEVKECIEQYGISAFSIRDDTFTLNKKRLFKILDGFRKLDVVWYCLTRADQVDEDTLYAMRDAGCVQIGYGVESGSQKILNNLRKGTTVEQNAEAIRLTKKAGIRVKTAFIVGSPGETWETVKESIMFVEENTPDEGFVGVFTPYPGSAVWNSPERFKMKILTRDVSKYVIVGPLMKGNVVVETEKMTAHEIEEAHTMVYTRFKELGIIPIHLTS